VFPASAELCLLLYQTLRNASKKEKNPLPFCIVFSMLYAQNINYNPVRV
jgi:hypothetical protein